MEKNQQRNVIKKHYKNLPNIECQMSGIRYKVDQKRTCHGLSSLENSWRCKL